MIKDSGRSRSAGRFAIGQETSTDRPSCISSPAHLALAMYDRATDTGAPDAAAHPAAVLESDGVER